jgi:hypothetical protein
VLGITFAVVGAALALLIRAVMSGRNWARIIYALLALFAIASIAFGWLGASPAMKVVGGALVIAYATILTLLFHSTSKPWFSKVARKAP